MPDVGMAEYQASRRHRILAACEKWWPLTGPHALPNKADCSGFVASVASELGVTLNGTANDIFLAVQHPPWSVIGTGEAAASNAAVAATNGYFVVAAWRAAGGGHGHVAVIVDTTQYHKTKAFQGRARAYWGTLGGEGKKYAMHTESFGTAKRPSVVYAACEIAAN
jgi:cell wall-associated NlpC family hydrolase